MVQVLHEGVHPLLLSQLVLTFLQQPFFRCCLAKALLQVRPVASEELVQGDSMVIDEFELLCLSNGLVHGLSLLLPIITMVGKFLFEPFTTTLESICEGFEFDLLLLQL